MAAQMNGPAISNNEIFIVDDDSLVHEALSAIFEQVGYRATSFFDGNSFLKAALTRTPACVILDMYMPGSSGLDLLKKLKAKNYPAPVLMFSGRGDIPHAVEAIRNDVISHGRSCTSPSKSCTRFKSAPQVMWRLGKRFSVT